MSADPENTRGVMPPMLTRFAVTGGRDYQDMEVVRGALQQVPLTAVLVHGKAPGADSLAARIWESLGGVCEPHPADWERHGKAAGPIRNQEMVDSGIGLLVAFPGGRGTADMCRRAEAADVRVIRRG